MLLDSKLLKNTLPDNNVYGKFINIAGRKIPVIVFLGVLSSGLLAKNNFFVGQKGVFFYFCRC